MGHVGVGGENPVRVQSMTNSDTRDVEATIDQVMRLADAGCEIARMTVQGKKEAEAVEWIKNGLVQRGYDIPLVADIHFFPKAAMMVADFVEKVRINPGNFLDKRATFKQVEFDDPAERLEVGFSPLVLKLKGQGKALRIGTNHGSLSDRIMSAYGDSPMGMCMSAIEYAEVCRRHDFHNLIFSMKSSNPTVMIAAYRLLVLEMEARGWDYPLHLGVTEAGDGLDGRVKSAMGIGSLLLDGIGDTIRVSLTEDPWEEIDPCKRLVRLFEREEGTGISDLPVTEIGRPNRRMPVVLGEETDLGVTELKAHRLREGRESLRGKETVIKGVYPKEMCKEDFVLQSAAEMGTLLIEGYGDGLGLEGPMEETSELSFAILQGARLRSTKTEYIACPSCGRTLFDLQEVTRRVKEKTKGMPGVKIAVMGCIVNGPGEMADADFGYVGSKRGKVDLYVGRERVERDIDEAEAPDRLLALINACQKTVPV